MLDLPYLLGLASAAGIASHLLYFLHGEHHIQAPRILRIYLTGMTLPYIVVWSAAHENPWKSLWQVMLLQATYFGSLVMSIAIYRLFMHRTSRFPGPKLAGLTKLYHCIHATDSRQYRWLDQLHHKYGDFVRTGPNEITIFHPDAILPVHSGNSRCTKAAWYDNLIPIEAVVTTRSRQAHDARRRVWDQGYSVKALQQHEEVIEKYARLVVDAIDARIDEDIDISKWVEYYGFDVMGVVQYSCSFDMLNHGRSHWVLDVFKGGTVILGYMTSIPWMIHICLSAPLLGSGFAQYSAWARESILHRIKNNPEKRDTMSWLLEHSREHSSVEKDWNWLMGDFLTMVTGGTEPVICAIIFLIYHLLAEPRHLDAVRNEISTLTSYSATVQLQNLDHLNACIFEALRLHPSIPTGGLRVTPPEGLKVGETTLPGNTTVLIPQYTVARREDCFEKAQEFVPERWTTKPGMVKNRVAFMPWGYGPYACVGKNLALMEIRTLAVVLLDNFDLEFASAEDGTLLHEKTLDCFATIAGPLRLKFSRREYSVKSV